MWCIEYDELDFLFFVLCVLYVMTNTASETRLTYHAKCTRLYDESKEARESKANTQYLAERQRADPSTRWPFLSFIQCFVSSWSFSLQNVSKHSMHVISVSHSRRAVLCVCRRFIPLHRCRNALLHWYMEPQPVIKCLRRCIHTAQHTIRKSTRQTAICV